MSDGAVKTRPATLDDAAAISAIYNHYVRHSTATYEETPESLDERLRWMEGHGPHHPVIVAEDAGNVSGWASLSRFHSRCAYRFTVENSVYVHPDHLRKGIGRALMIDLIAAARALGHHTIIAGISADQEPSLRLHTGLGFVEVARLREVGFKFGRWLDVVYMQLML
jgi:phosphinothricin acetyltransferase